MVSSKARWIPPRPVTRWARVLLVDVLTVQSQMFNATRNYLRSRYQYIINGLSLKQQAGILSREDIARVNDWLQK